MSAPTAVHFVELVEKSGLVTPQELDDVFGGEFPGDAAEIASALVKANKLTAYQAKQLLAGKHRGFLLGPYKVLRPVGRGGMGTVFLGEHTSLDRKVALKVLTPGQAKDKLTLERFQREARAAAALDHPNIVRLHDISQGGGVHFLVMEFVDGNDLQTLMGQTGPLHYAQAAQYIAQAAAGLQHAHAKGFIHRDVKPANLMLAKDGTVKILDMGLARSFLNDKDNLTAVQAEGEIAGTVDYLSPEQSLNHPLDERSDLYSLGATFYALLTGHPPFAGTTAQKLLQHQMKEPPSLSKKLNGRVPPALAAVISKMMAKNKSERYQTAEDVIDALGPWLPAPSTGSVMHDPVTRSDFGVPTSFGSRPARPGAGIDPKRKKLYIAGGIAAAVAVVGVAVALLSGGSKPDATAGPPVAAGTPAGTSPAARPEGSAARPDRPAPPKPVVAPTPAAADTPDAYPARGRFQPIGFGPAASAPAGGPLFARHPGDKLPFDPSGEQTVLDVPFVLPDPGDKRNNIITLYGPMSEPTRQLPRSARVAVGGPVRELHFLGGVSAWGWPFEGSGNLRSEKGTTTVVVRLEYADGQTEDHEWKNGEHFADYIKRIDVPDSEFAFLAANGKQVRYLSVVPRRADQVIAAVEFVKGEDDKTSPAIIALTVERPDGTAPPKPAADPASRERKRPEAPPAGQSGKAPQHVPLNLGRLATVVASDPPGGKWGAYTTGGVPFDLIDPKGGRANGLEPAAGRLVPCFLAAKAVHVLAFCEPSTVRCRVRLHYAGQDAEEVELADAGEAAPGVRRLTAAPTKTVAVSHIEFVPAGPAAGTRVLGVTVETL